MSRISNQGTLGSGNCMRGRVVQKIKYNNGHNNGKKITIGRKVPKGGRECPYKYRFYLDMVAHTSNPSTRETEAGG